MLLKRRILEEIAAGSISLVFRRWSKPTVRAGGTVKTAVGMLAIGRIDPIALSALTTADARRAGYPTRVALQADLAGRERGTVYRVEVQYAGADPRVALRERSRIGEDELAEILARLERLDRHTPWTRHTLALIARYPGRRAAEFAGALGQDTAPFKSNVRKLKALGLTESLKVGYRLSPRGRTVLVRLGRSRAIPRLPRSLHRRR